ncbi:MULTISPECIES: alpha/beta hydrolase [Luteimonas]|uniref:alpha/beta hydrolase n=1 Tax=Luteimonas TaxID=83614 RepID=UPI000C7E0A7B|nr:MULTISPECIES: alpha/beta hydrolase [Luteimonas]
MGVLLLLALLPGCVYHLKEDQLIRPRPAPAVALDVLATAYPDYRIEAGHIPAADGASLATLRLTRPDARATVLYFGGNGYRIGLHAGHSATAYRDVPVNLVLVDHRGYGGSTGTPTTEALMADALHVYDHFRADTASAGMPLLVHGQSLGSFMAGHVAAQRRLDGLVLESSTTTAEDWARDMRSKGSLWMRLAIRRIDIAPPLRRFGNQGVVATLEAPVLFVVGANDQTTAPGFSRTLYEATPLPEGRKRLLVVPDRSHDNASRSPEFTDAMQAFVAQVASG